MLGLLIAFFFIVAWIFSLVAEKPKVVAPLRVAKPAAPSKDSRANAARKPSPIVRNEAETAEDIPVRLQRFAVPLIDLNEKIDWIETRVKDLKANESWRSATAIIHDTEFSFGSEAGQIEFVAKKSLKSVFVEIGTTERIYPPARVLTSFLFNNIHDKTVVFRAELSEEAFDWVKPKLRKISEAVSVASRAIADKKEKDHLESLSPGERDLYIRKKAVDQRYFALIIKKLDAELTHQEAREFLALEQIYSEEQKKKEAAAEALLEARRAELLKKFATVRVSDDRNDYVFSNDDYKRGSDKERDYAVKHKATLFRVFDNKCAKCGDDENGLDLDHFIFSKNEGGCFVMTHCDGHFINNAIPLCQFCNRSKSDKSYKAFFSPEELVEILKKNAILTARLNELPGDASKRKKSG